MQNPLLQAFFSQPGTLQNIRSIIAVTADTTLPTRSAEYRVGMNKQDLVAEVRARLDVSRRAATEAIDAVFESIVRAVSAGERVTLPGFGTFEPRIRAPRAARNPKTGERVMVPTTTVVVFRPGAALRQKVDGSKRLRAKASTPTR